MRAAKDSIEPRAADVEEQRKSASAAEVDEQGQSASAARSERDLAVDAATSDRPYALPHQEQLSQTSNLRYLSHTLRTSLPLVACDQLQLFAAIACATWGFHLSGVSGTTGVAKLGLCLGCGLFLAFLMGELYPAVGLSPTAEARRCTVFTSLVFAIFLLAEQLYDGTGHSAAILIAAWFLSLISIPLGRYVGRRIFCRFSWWMQPVVILGRGNESRSLYRTLASRPHLGLSPIGILEDMHEHWSRNGVDGVEYLGPLEAAPEIARQRGVYRAIVAMPERPVAEVHDIVESSSDWFPHLIVIPNVQALPLLWTKVWHLGGYSGFQMRSRLLLPFPRLMKRIMDLTAVVVLAPVIAPLVLGIAVAIKLSSRGPVFYTQPRIGRGGKRFRVWKFRTMVANADEVLHEYLLKHPELREEWESDRKLKDDPRIVPTTGQFLRKYSLDELPQLWNVLKGEMSLIGPRPLPQYHLDEFGEEFCRYRERILPGITGLWQVTCRSDGDPRMFVKWDRYYIRNWSIWLDLWILSRTLKVVLYADGAY